MNTQIHSNAQEYEMANEVELSLEELGEVIASGTTYQHNETLVSDEIELNAEELEEVIAPKIALNHNEMLVSDEIELNVEELEEVVAPGIWENHNETLVGDEIELNAEELEEVIAPKDKAAVSSPSAARITSSRPLPDNFDEFGCGTNHNETLLSDDAPMT